MISKTDNAQKIFFRNTGIDGYNYESTNLAGHILHLYDIYDA